MTFLFCILGAICINSLIGFILTKTYYKPFVDYCPNIKWVVITLGVISLFLDMFLYLGRYCVSIFTILTTKKE